MATESRITDPKAVKSADVQAILDAGWSPTVQFSKPGYSRELLRNVNRLCAEFGPTLEVRFYGHYGSGFNAKALTELPDVQWLSIDCLERISNEDELARLGELRRLSFGVHEFDRPSVLNSLEFKKLRELSLSSNKRTNFDLGFIARFSQLTELFVQGHTKNIVAISTLPRLKTLRLSGMPKKQELSFVNSIESLRSLTLLLGGRSTIDEIKHPTLEELEVNWVRSLETLGNMGRFPNLRRLRIEDQLQLRVLPLEGLQLRELSAFNCKNLDTITGLDEQEALEEFRIGRTKLVLDALVAHKWPASMKIVAIYSGSEKWNKTAREMLDQRGYGEFRAIKARRQHTPNQ